ncbi:MAG: hypothetical protein RIE32_13110 [Phycisphaerales bacterium]
MRRGEKTSRLTVRFEQGAVHVSSDDVLTPAIQLWRARRAMRRAGARPAGVPITLSLGRLPRIRSRV